ncbi:thioredoxin family protein [Caenimonas sedimenti]|uniref:Thioredoxin family protein n=1 Tax=Caenimonas sedimenti TaxID=2596921 RepID=A0A562ZQF4_9BURK|nr:thioredoxin family protein [Caenimonas sedimenti]TWO70773.1 thioredoxin family protein [Caenimonas sedimenti]
MDEGTREIGPRLWVIALCAGWCGVCRDWRPAFLATARAHPEWRFAWVDVEDEDEAMGGVDITTFPSVLIARGREALFFGAIGPSQAALERLASALENQPALLPGDAQALLERLLPEVLPRTST